MSTPAYELIYWPSIPGRGEFVRLALEATGTTYTDVGNASEAGIQAVLALKDENATTSGDGNPPAFAPPALKIPGEGKDGKALILYQTPSILSYLGDKLNLAGADASEKHWVLSHALTALDLNNEAHDTHHPIAVHLYYEDQKEESLNKAKYFREARLPKFFGFFERVLKANDVEGKGKFLVGGKLSYADTTVWQVLDGLKFAFPKELAAIEKDYPTLFGSFYASIKDGVLKDYLASKRRMPYSQGIFRHYPELDRQ